MTPTIVPNARHEPRTGQRPAISTSTPAGRQELTALYAARGRPAPAVLAAPGPALALEGFVALARPVGTLAVAQLLILCGAIAGLAALASGTANGLWIGRMLAITSVVLMPLAAGCPTAPGGPRPVRRIWLPGLAPAACTLAAALGAPGAPGPVQRATLAAGAEHAAACVSCLLLLGWPVLARLQLGLSCPGLLRGLGWAGVLRGARPLAPALAPLLGEALAGEAAGDGRHQALAACRGVPTRPGHGRAYLALVREAVGAGVDWATPRTGLGRGCPEGMNLWPAARQEAALVRRCHGPVAPVPSARALAALGATEAVEGVLAAAWLLEGVAVVLAVAEQDADGEAG